jgi:hypothetical protein
VKGHVFYDAQSDPVDTDAWMPTKPGFLAGLIQGLATQWWQQAMMHLALPMFALSCILWEAAYGRFHGVTRFKHRIAMPKAPEAPNRYVFSCRMANIQRLVDAVTRRDEPSNASPIIQDVPRKDG